MALPGYEADGVSEAGLPFQMPPSSVSQGRLSPGLVLALSSFHQFAPDQ